MEKYGAHRVLVSSFSRSSVRELLRRDLPIPEDHVGTLHALIYRKIDSPEIVEVPKHFKLFSEEYPQWSIGEGTRDSLDDGYASGGNGAQGDACLQEYARLRALMRPRELWPPSLLDFAKAWESYKKETGGIDFADIIEIGTRDLDYPPGLPDIAILDETQDFCASEIACLKKWSEKLDRIVWVGDPDQAIYNFKGASPEHLLTPLPPEYTVVLRQSYRVPRAIHDFAEKLIRKIPPPHRFEREYLPRDADGEIKRVSASFKNPEQLLRLAETYTWQGKSCLFLSSCSYQLSPIIEALRSAGTPFSNPYRRRRRDWNPLFKARDTLGAAERVQAFLSAFVEWDVPLWTPDNLRKWTELTKGVLCRGGREKLYNMGGDAPVPACELLEVIPLSTVTDAQKGGLEWLSGVLSKQWERSASYAIRIALRDPERLSGEPLIQVGTIHSVKGGESQVVILCPDVSPQGMRQFVSGAAGRADLVRLFYVGATRASESLILAAPGSRLAIPWW